jgi:Protein implicated in ribosomal biogenesis, Nop56p homolog
VVIPLKPKIHTKREVKQICQLKPRTQPRHTYVVEEKENKKKCKKRRKRKRRRKRKKGKRRKKRRKKTKRRRKRKKKKREGRERGRKRGRLGPPEDEQIQFLECCVLLCPVTNCYSITMITVAQTFGLVTCQLTLVCC